jgi:hypothetical protein
MAEIRKVRRRFVTRLVVTTSVAASLAIGTVGLTPNAHASIDHTTHVFDVPSSNDPRPFVKQMQVPGGPTCDHIPGILREGHFFAVTQAIGGSRSSLHLEMTTHYRPEVAAAAANWSVAHPGTTPTCDQLNANEGKQPFNVVRHTLCDAGSAAAGSRYCQLATRDWNGLTTPPQINFDAESCQNLYDVTDAAGNTHDARDYGFAEWDNMRVFQTDTHGKHVVFDDLNLRMGVRPTEADGTTDLTKPIATYGKVQTYSQMSLWLKFYDNVARAKGQDPVAHPNNAYNLVDAAVSSDQQLTFANPQGAGTVTAKVGAYKKSLRRQICTNSPWVGNALGDASRADYAQPWVLDASGKVVSGGVPANATSFEFMVGTCDVGFRFMRANSAKAVQSYLQDFVRHENNGQLPDELKGVHGQTIPMIVASAWSNTGTMSVNDPTQGCAPQLNLGVGRWNHGVNLVKNLGDIL